MTPRYHPDSVHKTRHLTGVTDRNRTGLRAGGDSPCTPDPLGVEEVNKLRFIPCRLAADGAALSVGTYAKHSSSWRLTALIALIF